MNSTFFCIDGHTAGNPVRLIAGGAPLLKGQSMSERRQDFLNRFDWIRTGLCFEPRGHSMMSGGFIYPPTLDDSDAGILFIETSGCLPMCGHGTIGIVTFALEHGLIRPKTFGKLKLEVPAGIINIDYKQDGDKITSVKIRNVPSYLAKTDIEIIVPDLGPIKLDVSYGGNYYAIIEPQGNYHGLDSMGAARIIALSKIIRNLVREKYEPIHPIDPTIRGVSHVLWADVPKGENAHGRNAVFYGESAIDRSPCGTGTSARLAHLYAKGKLQIGQKFIHQSYICSEFIGTVEESIKLGDYEAIIPSIEGSAISTGINTIWINEKDKFHSGFEVI